jgi:hypothetical protein
MTLCGSDRRDRAEHLHRTWQTCLCTSDPQGYKAAGITTAHTQMVDRGEGHLFRSKRYAIRERPSLLEQKYSSKAVHHQNVAKNPELHAKTCYFREIRAPGPSTWLTGAGRCFGDAPIAWSGARQRGWK